MVNQNGKLVVVSIPTDPHLEPNEASPLNQRGHDNNFDSSASAVTSEQSTKKLIDTEMDHSKKRVFRIGIDFLLLCCVGLPIIFLFFFGEPYERGFFCNDESLMHPYHKSTVKHWMLYVFGLIMPLIVILAVELLRTKLNVDEDRQMKIFNWDVPVCIQNIYKYIGLFLFGAACCQLATDIAKLSIGRLRPHFITVCQPIMNDGTNCKNPVNMRQYIVDFTCSNPQATDQIIKDMRMSFPSANSSFSFFTMIFTILYLHLRFNWKGSKLLKYFIQFLLLMMAWFTSLSRISDYKHHWSDVFCGSILGIFFAAIASCIQFIDRKNKHEQKLPITKYELNMKTRNGNES